MSLIILMTNPNGPDEISELEEKTEEDVVKFESCPECHQQTLKMESSCESCVDSECGYTRCSG
jgi:hypothetical protein